MSQTTNYALDKYDAGDVPNLLDQYNSSMDTIDLQLKSQSDRITTLEAGGGSGSGTTVSAGTGVSVTGSSSAGYTVSLNEASSSSIGGVCVVNEVDPSAPLPMGDPCVPTREAVKEYVDAHSSTGGGLTPNGISVSNGLSKTSTSSTAVTISGVNASTSQVGVVRLTTNVGDNSSNVPTAAAVKTYVDSHSGGGGVSAVNASNGLTGSISGSTLTISGVNATATQPGVVQKVTNVTGGSTDSVPTCSAVISYVADQIETGGGAGIKTASGSNGISAVVSGTNLDISASNASTSAKGVVQLASSGSSSTQAATASYVNSVAEDLTAVQQLIHQSVSASGTSVQSSEGDIFILPRLGIGIAMLYLQTSSTLSAGAQVKYNYTVPTAYRPPQQAQVLRLYNHLTGSGLLGQVRTDGSIYISVEGGTGLDFVGAVTVVWGFEPL